MTDEFPLTISRAGVAGVSSRSQGTGRPNGGVAEKSSAGSTNCFRDAVGGLENIEEVS